MYGIQTILQKHGSNRLRRHQLPVWKFSATFSPVYAIIRSVFFGLLFLLVSYQSSLFSKKLKLFCFSFIDYLHYISRCIMGAGRLNILPRRRPLYILACRTLSVFSSLLLLSVLPPWFALLHCTVVVSPQGGFPLSHSPGPLGGTGRGRRLQLPPHWPLR